MIAARGLATAAAARSPRSRKVVEEAGHEGMRRGGWERHLHRLELWAAAGDMEWPGLQPRSEQDTGRSPGESGGEGVPSRPSPPVAVRTTKPTCTYSGATGEAAAARIIDTPLAGDEARDEVCDAAGEAGGSAIFGGWEEGSDGRQRGVGGETETERGTGDGAECEDRPEDLPPEDLPVGKRRPPRSPRPPSAASAGEARVVSALERSSSSHGEVGSSSSTTKIPVASSSAASSPSASAPMGMGMLACGGGAPLVERARRGAAVPSAVCAPEEDRVASVEGCQSE